MKLGSLKVRLMALAVIWVIASLVAAAFVLQYLFTTNLERDARANLDAVLTRLVALIDLDAGSGDLRLTGQLTDPRYDTPLGGRYWQVGDIDSGEQIRSRSLWDMTIPAVPTPEGTLGHFEGPDGWHLIYLSRTIEAGDRHFEITAGQDHASIHAAAQAFGWDVARLLTMLGIVIIAAARLQLQLGLGPLNRLRLAIDDVRTGNQTRLGGDFPTEVLPLVDEVNGLLEEREANTERARRRASDLAHGLKTPLAALHGVALRIRDKGNGADADMIDDLAFEMSKRVDYQMRLAALRVRNGDHQESTSLNSAVIRTLTVLKKTGRGETLHWVAELPHDCEVDIHRQDLMELVGVLLENAAKWARTEVVIRSRATEKTVDLRIMDDGPGIPDDRLSLLGVRGQRLDESAPGNGLGLAIAGEILSLNRGTIAYGRADSGGLAVTITLPLTGR